MPTGTTPSSSNYRIAETDTFRKQLNKNRDYQRIYRKIRDYVYPLLRENPFFGPNIKHLRGDLSEFYRYRIGDYRLFYTIDMDTVIVFVVRLDHRKDAY
ncbi:MAG: type II toxin-antitoxin system mRNA interferase toxin, RelE/StbE family [Spirochaetes bacterium]|nr:type II toxin-antitoxin system mRNA interferase toxin, RelE/StbE family [Spirochaetota bacterium]